MPDTESSSPDVVKSSTSTEKFDKGIVFYMREKSIVGILMWNVFGKMPIARKVRNFCLSDPLISALHLQISFMMVQ